MLKKIREKLAELATHRDEDRAEGGFTLIELLVVVAIIVMLAGVGGYYLIQRYEESKISRAKIDAEALSSQIETYKLNNGDYPASIEALAQPQPNGGSPLVPPKRFSTVTSTDMLKKRISILTVSVARP